MSENELYHDWNKREARKIQGHYKSKKSHSLRNSPTLS